MLNTAIEWLERIWFPWNVVYDYNATEIKTKWTQLKLSLTTEIKFQNIFMILWISHDFEWRNNSSNTDLESNRIRFQAAIHRIYLKNMYIYCITRDKGEYRWMRWDWLFELDWIGIMELPKSDLFIHMVNVNLPKLKSDKQLDGFHQAVIQ